jgi:hypothetical protein
VSESAHKLDLSVGWEEPRNRFRFSSVQALGRNNRVLADLVGNGPRAKLRTKRTFQDPTFRSFTIYKPRGTRKLRFRVKAQRIVSSEKTEIALTQRRR